eukprot:EG_transcript_2195
MSITPGDDSRLSRPAAAFLNVFQPDDPGPSLLAPADPHLPKPNPPPPLPLGVSAASACPSTSGRPPLRCPLSLTLALVSGLPICVVGFLAWGVPFLNLTAAIDPLALSIRTLVFALLERDLTLTWANMRAVVLAQRRLWDVQGQPADAFAQAEALVRLMWPVLQSNPKLMMLIAATLHGDAVHMVAAHNLSAFGPCVGLQNGTHRWFEGWDFARNGLDGKVLQRGSVLSAVSSFNTYPYNQTTPSRPFTWIPVYHPPLNLGNVFSANVGLFDARGRYSGRFGLSVSTNYIAQFLAEQLASQPATRGGRLALYDELGMVVAASHGAWNVPGGVPLTAVGDSDLAAAGTLLQSQEGDWCPDDISLEVKLSIPYFLDVNLFADSYSEGVPLRWCAVLLSPRENTMRFVDRSVSFATAFVCGTTLGSTVLAVALGLLVTRPIKRLTSGMSALKAGRFPEARRATGRKSVFRELFVAQGSYDSLVEAIDAFGKYVPATVVRGLLAGTIRPELGMTEKDVVVAFMDVENFTDLCESNPAEDIVSVTCQLFDTCCDIILHSQGTVDKFIGDCVMAMWGAPTPLPQPAVGAVEALIEILRMLRRQPLACGDGSPVGLLIGAHGGRCLVGNFGATARWDYTAVGDVVNAAARLAPLNKQFGTHCLVAGVLRDQATGSAWATCCMRPMGDAVVVGKRRALAVYEVREQPVDDREGWELAVQQFATGELAPAADYFRALPNDAAARAFLEDVGQTPPGGPFCRTMRSK